MIPCTWKNWPIKKTKNKILLTFSKTAESQESSDFSRARLCATSQKSDTQERQGSQQFYIQPHWFSSQQQSVMNMQRLRDAYCSSLSCSLFIYEGESSGNQNDHRNNDIRTEGSIKYILSYRSITQKWL